MQCPKCQEPLNQSIEHGVTADRCPGCKIVFFDMGELGQVLDRPAIESALAAESDPELPGGVCPRCSGALFGAEVAGIRVDVCNQCHGMVIDAAQIDEATAEGQAEPQPEGVFARLFSGLMRNME